MSNFNFKHNNVYILSYIPSYFNNYLEVTYGSITNFNFEFDI